MKKSELEQIIREIVQKEFKATAKAYVQTYLPLVIREVVDELVEKKLQEIVTTTSRSKPTSLKEQVLRDIGSDTEEWTTLGGRALTSADAPRVGLNRSKIAGLAGSGRDINLVDKVVNDSGVEIQVDPSKIPESLVIALNTDYRGFMSKLNQHKGKGASIPLGAPIAV